MSKKKSIDDIAKYSPLDEANWRKWLEEHHLKEDAVWLIMYKKSSKDHNLSWSEAVNQALCFGWIDSVKRSIDHEKFMQYFSKRKEISTWSKINKDKIDELRENGQMTAKGEEAIKIAKENGSWTYLDSVDNLEVPKDLADAFSKRKNVAEYYESLSVGKKKMILYWLLSAKKEATRKKRIIEIIEAAEQGDLPKKFFS